MSRGSFTLERLVDTEEMEETAISVSGTGRTVKLHRWHIYAVIIGVLILTAIIIVVVVSSKHNRPTTIDLANIDPTTVGPITDGSTTVGPTTDVPTTDGPTTVGPTKTSPPEVDPKIPACGISGKYAERIAAISSNRIDPCQDFSTFACSQNTTKRLGENKIMSSTFSNLAETVLNNIRPLLEEPKLNYEPRAVRMAKQMYYDCLYKTSFSSYYNNKSWLPFTNDSQFPLETQLAQIFAHNDQSIFSLEVDVEEDTLINHLTFNKGQPVQAIIGFIRESEKIVAFEEDLKKLWEESTCEEDKGDIWSGRKNNRNFTLGYIQTQIPQIKWTRLVQNIFDILGLEKQVSSEMKVEFRCFEFFRRLGTLIETAGPRNVVKYIVARYRIESLFNLDNELFQNSVQSGSKGIQENEDQLRHRRWKSCAGIVKTGLGVALAHLLYLQKGPKTAEIVQEITQYLKTAFRLVISIQNWIPAKGKDQLQKQLIDKLKQMRISNGYPDYIMNATTVDEYYDGLFLNQSSFMLNVLEMKKFLALKKFTRVHKKLVDLVIETLVDPMNVGAFYDVATNQILIPIAMLYHPMFDERYPMYLNFANLGVVIAHEIVHGFDNYGVHYNKNGKFTSWRSNDAQIEFRKQAICFVEQYGKFKIPLIDQSVDGNETLGENISDNAGFHLSFLAYEMWAKDRNVKEPLISGLNFTITQIFHIAYSQLWCEIPRQEMSHAHTHDVHSPGPLRVVGVVQNSANFGNAFGCPEGSPMNPTCKCSLWS